MCKSITTMTIVSMMSFDTSILKMIWGGRKQSLEGKINSGYKSAELHLEDKNGIHNPAKQHC